MTNLAIAANGLRKSYGDKIVLDGVDLAVPEGTVFALLGPNGAGKTTAVKILSTLDLRRPGHRRHPHRRPRPGRRPPGGARRDRRHRPVLRRGRPDHRRGEHAPHGGPAPPLPQRGAAGRRRTPGTLRPGGGREEARLHLLRRHETPPGHRHDPGRQPADHLPRRTHHRPRPTLPPQHVADHPRARHRRRHRLPHHPVPGGGRRTRRPHRRTQRRQDRRRGHRRRTQAAHPRRTRTAALRRPGRLPVRRPRPARGHPRRRSPDPADPQRRQPTRTALHPRPARRGRHRGRRTHRAHPRPRRRLLRPHRHHHPATQPAQPSRPNQPKEAVR